MARTVALEDGTITALLDDPAAVAALPHLLGALAAMRKAAPSGCRTCGGREKARNELRQAYARVKQAVVASSPADKATLKGLLKADLLVVHVAGPSGAVATMTF